MVDTLSQEVHKNYDKKRVIIVLIIVILLLLLWLAARARRAGDTTNNITNEKLGDVLPGDLFVDPQYVNYNLPGLDLPTFGNSGNWDWMQTTDCACDCSATAFVPTTPAAIMMTQYAYIAGPIMAPYVPTPFPVYTAPPLPTWWYEPGYNVHHEQAMYVYTSDGVTGIRGKYSRSAWNDPMHRGAYPQQTKNVTLQGDDAYLDGRHYKHDPRKDKAWPPAGPQASYTSWS